ncbi:MAG: hypothetical protein R3F65_29835 [bacterium]
MSDAECGEQAVVLAAAARGDWSVVMAHTAGCAACAALLPALMAGDDAALDRLLGRISADEAAARLAVGFEGGSWTPSPADAARLAEARASLDAESLDAEELEAAAPRQSARRGRVLAFPPGGRSAVVALAAAAVALAAAAALFVVGPWSGQASVTRAPGLADGMVARGGSGVELRAVVGGAHCFSSRLHQKKTCRWDPRRDELQLYYRLEPGESPLYLAVFAVDAKGEVSVLHPEADAGQRPLAVTRNQKSELCSAGLCWLLGGEYAGVEPGSMSIVGVFDDEPLPVEALREAVKGPAWRGDGRLVERFELEVAR